MDAAERENLIVRNSTEGITRHKEKPAPKQILNNAQMERFMDVIREDSAWHDFFYTELTTGMRRGELLALRWENLDFNTGKLHIDKQVYPV